MLFPAFAVDKRARCACIRGLKLSDNKRTSQKAFVLSDVNQMIYFMTFGFCEVHSYYATLKTRYSCHFMALGSRAIITSARKKYGKI
jgi:hypothetical protein